MTLITKIEYVALSGIELGAGKSFIYKKKYYEWQTSTVSLVLCARQENQAFARMGDSKYEWFL